MPQPEQRPKVTLEDLLRLKRAERPTAEFWTSFEFELRQKQLTALLKKRSWWQELPQLLARHAYVPVGATAIFAFTLVSVKYFPASQVAAVEAAPMAVGVRTLTPAPAVSPVSAPVSSVLLNRNESASLQPEATAADTSVISAPAVVTAPDVMPVMVAPAPVETASARSIAANLARLEQAEPELVNSVLGSRLSPPARDLTAAAATTIDELSTVSAGSGKRNRLLVSYTDRPLSPEPTAPSLVRERLARRLGDPEITDRISRIGIKGDAVSLGLTLRL
jgi:hypothetical protein